MQRIPSHNLRATARLLGPYVRLNLQAALEYRASFFSQALAMLLNDGMWLVFWIAFFDRFRLVAGWGRLEIVTLWAVVAAGYGIATTIFGNLFRLAGMIARGEIDSYMTLPVPVLPHVLMSRMNLTAPGDILFALIGFAWLVRPDPVHWALFVFVSLTTAAIFAGFGVITQSLSFWLGNAEGLAGQLANAMISFATYPTVIFRGAIKVALFTVIPAGFIAFVPVRLLQSFSWPLFAGLVTFAIGIFAAASFVFAAGLRRYESGNLVLLKE